MLLTFNAVSVLEIVLNLFLLLLSPNNEVGAVLSHFTDEEIKKILQGCFRPAAILCGGLECKSTSD